MQSSEMKTISADDQRFILRGLTDLERGKVVIKGSKFFIKRSELKNPFR